MARILTFLVCLLMMAGNAFNQAEAHGSDDKDLARAGVTGDDWVTIQDVLQKDSFVIDEQLLPGEDVRGAYNIFHGLDVRFPAGGGMRLGRSPKQDTTGEKKKNIFEKQKREFGKDWWFGLKPTAVYSGLDHVKIQSRPHVIVKENRLENQYAEGLAEWLVNGKKGVEQGFVVEEELRSQESGVRQEEQKLIIELEASGTAQVFLDQTAQRVVVRADEKGDVLMYHKLFVTDVTGKVLPAWFELEGREQKLLRIVCDTENARFPITIDPLAESPNWTASGEADNDNFGVSVSGAGDVNGDGYADVIVGAYRNAGGGTQRGKVYVFLGSASGVQSATNWTAVGEADNDYFGRSVSGAGDVNGDGYADVIVGAYQHMGFSKWGKAYVFLGGTAGIQNTTNWTAVGEVAGDYFGQSVSGAGDVNGDGYADVIVGAYQSGACRGKAYVFLGSADGVQSATNWTAVGEVDSDFFGYSVSGAGDVNGDGYADVIVGAYQNAGGGTQRGKAYVFLGSAAGVQNATNWTAVGEANIDYFGQSVSGAGDVNGDGYADVIVGAYQNVGEIAQLGKTYVFLGSASGVQNATNWTAVGETGGDYFGYSVSGAGDVNGDGYADVIVGAYGNAGGGSWRGKAYLFLGSAGGVQSATNWTAVGAANSNDFGWSVSGAGDVNGDGYADVIVGAVGADGGTQRGKAYVFQGSAGGVQSTTNWTAEGETYNDFFGHSVAKAGDVNGDGYVDVIVGAYGNVNGDTQRGKAYVFLGSAAGVQSATNWTAMGEADSDRFGYSVSGAGDVNGDGYADVIVGAYRNSGGGTYRGKAYVFLGSAAGVQSATNWTAVGEADNDYFGRSVSGAGDVNGDGYADVIVGAYGNAGGGTQRGKTYVFLGSARGVQSATNWTAVGEADSDFFGYSVSGAGDVNGDGYADIIVGAYIHTGVFSQRGKAYVFLGSAGGVQNTTNWMAVGEADNDRFGWSLSGAGDVNGDGYADVIVGAPQNAFGASQRGKAYVFLGSADGVQSATNWTAEGEADTNCFGNSVSGVGDVNGGGYADVIVGAPLNANGGKTYAFLGGDSGRVVKATQLQPVSYVPIAPGGMSVNTGAFDVAMYAVNPAGRGGVKLEVQAVPAGSAFGTFGTITNLSAIWRDTGTNGIVVTNHVTGLAADTAYHWRARVLYAGMSATNAGITNAVFAPHSPWRSFQAKVEAYDMRTSPSPQMQVLGTNGEGVASGESPAVSKGTDFGTITFGNMLTNVLIVTNESGTTTLIISGVSTSGTGAARFRVVGLPAAVSAGAASNFGVVFDAAVISVYTAGVTLANDSTNPAYVLNLKGTVIKADQTITFPNPGDQAVTNTVRLSATASSGLPVSFAVGSGLAQIADNTNLTFTGTGQVSVLASQTGNTNWNAAPNVTNSFNVFAEEPLLPPQNVTASDGNYVDKVAVSWSMVSGAVGYQVWRHTANDSSSATQIGTASQTNYNDTSAAVGVLYYYWVKATNISSVSTFSSPDSGWRTSLADPVMVDNIGNWYVWFSGSGYQIGGPWNLGVSGTPVAADFDGDRYTDVAIVDNAGNWYVWFTSAGYRMGGPWNLGVLGTPVAADFDGDRYADPAMVGNTLWHIWLTTMGYQLSGPWNLGVSGTPVAADFDGDWYADPAMVDNTLWHIWLTTMGYQLSGPWNLGVSGTPAAADFDGDQYADPAMVDNHGAWYVWFTSMGYQMSGPFYLGVPGMPLAADFDGR